MFGSKRCYGIKVVFGDFMYLENNIVFNNMFIGSFFKGCIY